MVRRALADAVTLQPAVTVTYIVLIVALIAVEVRGVVSRKRGDTLSEHWWAIQARWQWVRYLLVLALAWVALHLGWRLV
jgi:hypothetical protein